MPEIQFSAGTHANKAARQLAELANNWNETYTGKFNGITMVADPGCKAHNILQAFWAEQERRSEEYRNSPEGKRAAQEAEDRKNNCQAVIDELMQRFETLDYENLDELVQFFDEMADPSDHIGVSFDRQRIVDTFAQHDFVASMNCGDEFDGDNRENFAGYLIGQALSGLSSIGAIHHIYHKFAAEWRGKFATV